MPSVLRPKRLLRHWISLAFVPLLLFTALVAYIGDANGWLILALCVMAFADFVDWLLPDKRQLVLRKAYQPGGEPLTCYRVTENGQSHLYIATGDEHLCWLTEFDGIGDAATVETLGEVRY